VKADLFLRRRRLYRTFDFFSISALGLDLDSLTLGAVDAIDRIDVFEELKAGGRWRLRAREEIHILLIVISN
jgi:hypothetical protein